MAVLQSLWRDVRFSLRSLGRYRRWTTVTLATLALGIGATTSLFSIVNAVLLRPLPYPDAQRVLSLSESGESDLEVVTSPTFAEWVRSARTLSALAVFSSTSPTLLGAREPERLAGLAVTASYFATLGVPPLRGRVFSAEEDRPGGPSRVVVSEQLWRRAFGGDAALVGKTILLDHRPHTVVGIMPASYTTARGPHVWLPLRLDMTPTPGVVYYHSVVARLRPDASVAVARRELAALARRADAQRPEEQRGLRPIVMTLHERRYGSLRPALLVLLAAVGVLLLIACANVSCLLLARATQRDGELAVRVALGATRSQLVRSLLVESLLLALGGSVLGLLLSTVVVDWFVRLAPSAVASIEGIGIDAATLTFTVVVAISTAVLFGLAPSLAAVRIGRPATAPGVWRVGGIRQQRVGRGIVVLELALTVILLTCAGLLARSFLNVNRVELGFRAEDALAASIELPESHYDVRSATGFHDALLERARTFPNIQAAALADVGPLEGARLSFSTRDRAGRQLGPVDLTGVSAGYFMAIGASLLAGRDFDARDDADAPRVAIVNATLARHLGGGADVVGRRIDLPMERGRDATIVAIVTDIRQRDLESAPQPALFVPMAQAGHNLSASLLLRTAERPVVVQSALRGALRTMDKALPTPAVVPVETIVAALAAPRRFGFVLLGSFAALATLLAAIGLFGVISVLVAQRTREMGIRLALGAEPRRLTTLVVGQGMRLVGAGMLIGLIGAVGAVRLLRHSVFGIDSRDPVTFAAGAALLAAVATLACWLPARRAANVDPLQALRDV